MYVRLYVESKNVCEVVELQGANQGAATGTALPVCDTAATAVSRDSRPSLRQALPSPNCTKCVHCFWLQRTKAKWMYTATNTRLPLPATLPGARVKIRCKPVPCAALIQLQAALREGSYVSVQLCCIFYIAGCRVCCVVGCILYLDRQSCLLRSTALIGSITCHNVKKTSRSLSRCNGTGI